MVALRQRLVKPWVVMPAVALVGLGGWLAVRPEDGSGDAAATPTESVVEATSGTMAQTVSAEGTLEPARTDELSFGAAGTVTAVNVEAGDRVRRGQVLASIDSAQLELDVADARSALADAEAALADDEDAGASDSQLAADRSSVVAAQDALASAEEALEGADLVATFAGTVSSVEVVEGEQLADSGVGGTDATGSDSGSGDSSSTLGDSSNGLPTGDDSSSGDDTSTADITVVDTSHYSVDLGFDETDVEQLAVGQDASISLATSSSSPFPGGGAFPGGGELPGGLVIDGGPQAQTGDAGAGEATTAAPTTTGDSVDGLVWEVGRVADASSGVASYPVTVVFEDPDGDFDAGADVSVEITYAEVEDAIQVPSLAITPQDDGTSTVTVRTDDGDEERTVATGLVSGTMTQITDGLEAGEQVVVSLPGGGPRGIDLGEVGG